MRGCSPTRVVSDCLGNTAFDFHCVVPPLFLPLASNCRREFAFVSRSRHGNGNDDRRSARAIVREGFPRRLVVIVVQLNDVPPHTALFSLLSNPCGSSRSFHSRIELAASHFGINPQPERVNLFAARRFFRFDQRMEHADFGASKLCAWDTRHTQVRWLSAICLRSTWQGEGFALPVASPPAFSKLHPKTLTALVSTSQAAASHSWAVRP